MSTQPAFEADFVSQIESVICGNEMLLAFPRGRYAQIHKSPTKITVIVPVYNGEARLERCLQSIAAQTDADFQAIIIDNCSTDRSLAIACRFASEHPQFLIYQNAKNLGRVGNWNRGLDLAPGQYIKPVMVNDFLKPGCLAQLGAVLDAHDHVVLARCSVTTLDQGKEHFGPLFESSRCLPSLEAIEYGITTGNPAAGPSAQMFRRAAIQGHELRFDTAYEWAADFEFALRLFQWGDMYYLREPLFVFEITNRFATNRNIGKELRDEIEVIGSSLARYESRLSPDLVKRARSKAESIYGQHVAKCVTKEESARCDSIWQSACARYPLLLAPENLDGAGDPRPVHHVQRLAALETGNQRWDSAVPEEVKFWEKWCRTQGGEWKGEFEFRLRPDSPLQDYVTQFLNVPPGGSLRLLDVGAGPLTDLGKQWPGRTVELTAVDPLGDHYNAILKRCGLTAPVPTQPIGAEVLTGSFALNHFDMVYARNSIDHSLDAPQAIDQMLAVLKPGGVMFMAHFISEATAAGNTGLHGWNFFGKDGDFMVEKYGGQSVNITRRYEGIAEVTCEALPEKRWITVVMKKLVPSVSEDAKSATAASSIATPTSLSQSERGEVFNHLKTAQDALNQIHRLLATDPQPQVQNQGAPANGSIPVRSDALAKVPQPARSQPSSSEELKALAHQCFRAGNWNEAGKHYLKLTTHFPDDLEIWRNSIECARRQNYTVVAKLILDDALRTHPAWKGLLDTVPAGSSAAGKLAAVCA